MTMQRLKFGRLSRIILVMVAVASTAQAQDEAASPSTDDATNMEPAEQLALEQQQLAATQQQLQQRADALDRDNLLEPDKAYVYPNDPTLRLRIGPPFGPTELVALLTARSAEAAAQLTLVELVGPDQPAPALPAPSAEEEDLENES